MTTVESLLIKTTFSPPVPSKVRRHQTEDIRRPTESTVDTVEFSSSLSSPKALKLPVVTKHGKLDDRTQSTRYGLLGCIDKIFCVFFFWCQVVWVPRFMFPVVIQDHVLRVYIIALLFHRWDQKVLCAVYGWRSSLSSRNTVITWPTLRCMSANINTTTEYYTHHKWGTGGGREVYHCHPHDVQ